MAPTKFNDTWQRDSPEIRPNLIDSGKYDHSWLRLLTKYLRRGHSDKVCMYVKNVSITMNTAMRQNSFPFVSDQQDGRTRGVQHKPLSTVSRPQWRADTKFCFLNRLKTSTGLG